MVTRPKHELITIGAIETLESLVNRIRAGDVVVTGISLENGISSDPSEDMFQLVTPYSGQRKLTVAWVEWGVGEL